MLNTITLAFACLALAGIFFRAAAIRKNAKIAETTGFKVIYSPVYMNETWWMFGHKYLVPLLNLLPAALTRTWLKLSQRWSLWRHAYAPFEEAGSDTVILATPSVNMLSTCDPVVMNSIWTQPKNVQQDVKILKALAIWGDNIVTTDGEQWQHHRRVVNAGFTPATHAAVWDESTEQAQSLIDYWREEKGSVVSVVKVWMSKLALHVVSSAFFHKKLSWKDQGVVPAGHKLAFEDALSSVVDNIQLIALFRRKLRWMPFKKTKEAYTAFTDWTAYMVELRQSILDRLEETTKKTNKSLLESIVVAGETEEGRNSLPKDQAFGNIFLTLLAGHETTANTLAFTLILLAIFPSWQTKIQTQLDKQLGTRRRSQWSFEQDYHALQQNAIYAVIKEVMRVYNVVQQGFRKTIAPTTLLDSQGVAHEVPAGTLCNINLGAAWRNPSRWRQPSASAANNVPATQRASLRFAPVLDFDPTRWLENPNLVNDEELKVPRFFPFGQGPRQCPGERFALVEMTAVIATIYKNYSLELVVSDETLKACGGDEEAAWNSTRDHALRLMTDGVSTNVNLELWKELPIRVVDR